MNDLEDETQKLGIDRKKVQQILTATRTMLLLKSPFYGSILMHLKFGTAPCGTACTDMERMLFDPEFVIRLSQNKGQLEFVMLHEVLHNVLFHPIRGRGKIHQIYNLATDIVVNATIMQSNGITEYEVDGNNVIWLAPNNKPGYLYTAEQVYNMLLEKYKDELNDVEGLCFKLSEEGNMIDNHDIWNAIPMDSILSNKWKQYLSEAEKIVGDKRIPPLVRGFLKKVNHKSMIDWRSALNEFIQYTISGFDYSFHPPDRRFTAYDFVLPGFGEIEIKKLENIWLLVDASGSVNDEMLTVFLLEIEECIKQYIFVSGKLSFFDTSVSEPIEFTEKYMLKKIIPVGGGGTSFTCIFKYLKEHMSDNLPKVIIIFTDGHANYPEENATLGIPVLWALVDNENEAPWGRTIHIKRKKIKG